MKELQRKQLVSGSADSNTQMLYFTCSSLSSDDKYIYLISDRNGGNPNIWRRNLLTGEETVLTHNQSGYLKSYVYFDGHPQRGLGKASVCLDSTGNAVYFIQDGYLCKVDHQGKTVLLNRIPDDKMTAFTHVSADGNLLCVPMVDARALDYDPDTEGYGLDKRPKYDIDGRVQSEKLSSYLYVYDTNDGTVLYIKKVPLCWITHVQFHPENPDIIMYNNEWASYDCGIRRIWIFDRSKQTCTPLRTEGYCVNGQKRSRNDWVCHEMWTDDGAYVIYHGAYENGPAFIGRFSMQTGQYWEIPLPEEYDAYGHFTISHNSQLVCDGYFRMPDEKKKVFVNSTDNGPDPHKKDAEYISKIDVDWEKGRMNWIPLCKHDSDWMGQDAHPHAIFNHKGNRIYFSSRIQGHVSVYCTDS
jgi:oligogalacturonide lyase